MSKDRNKDLEQKAQEKEYQAKMTSDPAEAARLLQKARELRAKKTN